MSKRVCITGSEGFIGRNLLEYLKDKDIEPVVFVGDLLKQEDLDKFFNKEKNIETVVHLAGAFFGDNKTLLDANLITTLNLLSKFKVYGINKIVFSSTGAVYGEPKNNRSKESDECSPNTFYGLTKLLAEESIKTYKNLENIDYGILRFPNVYGKYNNKGVIYSLYNNAVNNGEININGDGNQRRDFLNVRDACKAIYLSIKSDKSGIYNVTNPNGMSLNELVKVIKVNVNKEIKVNYLPSNNNLVDLLLDPGLAEKELGFTSDIKEIELGE